MRRLNGPEIGILRDALFTAFPIRNRFADLLLFRLGRHYTTYQTLEDAHPDVIKNVISQANAELWIGDLLREARNTVPGDSDLMAFGEQFGLAPRLMTHSAGGIHPVTGPQLQLKIKETQSTYDIVTWRKLLGEIEGRVCRVECPIKTAVGTGFLIGPNAVLTNYHVVEQVDRGELAALQVRLRFDYKVTDDGVAVEKGLVYKLAEKWLFDHSRYSDEDKEVNPAHDPTPEELDYAILRVDGTPGNDYIGGKTDDPNAIQRGWVPLPATAHDFASQPAIYIVQHPDGQPMQVALDSNGVVGVNEKGTRVRYTTTTAPGSSGSPCFGPNWELVAVHHLGDPKYLQGQRPTYNQGIPIAAIQQLLTTRKKQEVFGGII
jgi:V8-like Glu-specific endopeptidase